MRKGLLLGLIWQPPAACRHRRKPARPTVSTSWIAATTRTDQSRWSPGVNVGKPIELSDNCYLIKHGADWLQKHAPQFYD